MTQNDDRKPASQEFSPEEQALGELLCAYLDDELNPTQRAEVEARIESDPTVREQLDELTFAADALRTLPSGSAPGSILDDITAQAERSELLGKPDESVTLARHRRGPFKSTMALAAMLMVAVSASLYVALQGKQNNSVQRQVAINKPEGRSAEKEAPKSAPADSRFEMDTTLASRGGSSDRGAELKQRDEGMAKRAIADLPVSKVEPGVSPEAAPTDSKDASLMRRNSGKPTSPRSEFGGGESDALVGLGGAATSTMGDKPVDDATSTVNGEQLADLGEAGAKKPAANAPAPSAMKDETAADASALGIESGRLDDNAEVASEEYESSAASSTTLASLDPQMTFEQKLVVGGGADVLANHAFPNEPLQLVLAVDNDAEQAIVEERLESIFKLNSLRSANSVEFVSEPTDGDVQLENWAVADDVNLAEDELYYEGNASQNEIVPTNSRQYLVRLQTPKFNQVVTDLTTLGVAEVHLAVGNMRSERPEEVVKLASQATGEPIVEETKAGPARSAAQKSRQVARDRRAQSNERPAPVPPTAQWLQALQSYGLLRQHDDRQQGRVAGQLAAKQKAHDATTNALPERDADDSQISEFAELPSPMPQRQELLTLVIELTNRSAAQGPPKAKGNPPHKHQPTKLKQ